MTSYPALNLKAAATVTALLLLIGFLLPDGTPSETTTVPISLEITAADTAVEPVQPPVLIIPESEAPVPVSAPALWKNVVIKPGDNLAKIFKRLEIPAIELQTLMDLGRDVKVLGKIMPGHKLEIRVDGQHRLSGLRYEVSTLSTLEILTHENQLRVTTLDVEPEVLHNFASATITSEQPSLYHAGKAAGLSDNILMKLSYMFQWDISFALDIREGDTFHVLYEEVFVDGKKVKDRDIIAASFSNMGKEHQAVIYENSLGSKDYYTPSGHSLRKAFIRDPVHFSHVSSSFNMRRLHPIHKRVMPHRGIDYAANRGTPVLASGDGKVTIARQNNASGRYVVIQHGEQYTTKYLHLSGYARGIKEGRAVKQGQTIGYVGATGWATAPHLHYEFLVAGKHQNPRTVKLPKAYPIKAEEMTRFRLTTAGHLTRLASLSGKTNFAQAEQSLPLSE